MGAGSLDSSSEVRDSAVGLQDRAYGVLLRRLLGTERDRVSVVTSTRVGGSAVVEVHLMEKKTNNDGARGKWARRKR